MNPFIGSLNRVGFLIWNILLFAWVIGFGLLIDATKSQHVGVYWLSLRIIWGLVLVVISILVFFRRLQNTGLSLWLAIIAIIPFVSSIFWLALFFIPPKQQTSDSTTNPQNFGTNNPPQQVPPQVQ